MYERKTHNNIIATANAKKINKNKVAFNLHHFFHVQYGREVRISNAVNQINAGLND